MSIQESLYGRFPVKRAVIDESTAAINEIVAAVAGKSIVVLNAMIKVADGQSLTWISGASTPLSGVMAFATGDLLYQAADSTSGVVATVTGARLALSSGAATQVSGHITYVEI